MSNAYAIVPGLGGLVLTVGGALALYVDRLDLLADPEAPRPITIRYTSQATYALKKRPHWIFVATTTLFAPLLMVTAVWQAQLAREHIITDETEDPERGDRLASNLQFFAFLCGSFAVCVSTSPMGNAVGTILHTIFAGVMAAMGINYMIRCQELADFRGDESLATARMLFWIVALGAAAIMCFSIYPGGKGTDMLLKHVKALKKAGRGAAGVPREQGAVDAENHTNPNTVAEGDDSFSAQMNKDILSEKEILQARISESVLAFGQILLAVMIGFNLFSAALEVGDLEESNDKAWKTALAAAAGSSVVVATVIALNEYFYKVCQAAGDGVVDDDDDDDNGEN